MKGWSFKMKNLKCVAKIEVIGNIYENKDLLEV
nr:MAG TPA: YopX protein [Caudoviricetes sp.]